MSENSKKEEPLRFTTVISDSLLAESVREIAARSGVALADLSRQGLIRVVKEFQRDGGVALLPLPLAEPEVQGAN
jgi:hypothetical protein